MNKIITILMLVLSVGALGAVKTELKKDENGRYSGSATLRLVARGRIVNPVSTKMLVISSENNSSIELKHKDIKSDKNNVSKGEFSAQILEKNEKGEYVISDTKKSIAAKLIDKENMKEVANKEREVKNLIGENVGEISYTLKDSGTNSDYNGEIISKVIARGSSKGVFVDNSTAVAILVK